MSISPRTILIRFASLIATSGFAISCLAALLLLPAPAAQAAGPVLKSQNPCPYSSGVCLEFSSANPPPKVLRALDFTAPSAGHALVSVQGSGVCSNNNVGNVQVADFATQITNRPNAVAAYTGNGGNRFAFTLPNRDAVVTGLTGNGVFNLAAQRLFAIGAAGVQHYSLNISVLRIDQNVFCDVMSVALSVRFIPQAAGPVLTSQNPCSYSSGVCLDFSSVSPPPKVLRALDFTAPGAGHALISVQGSGVCENGGSFSPRAVFETQIVNKPDAVADYRGNGGNRFEFQLPPSAGVLTGNGVFNLASQRLFAISAAGVQHYSLNISIGQLDPNVGCRVLSVALTALFLPSGQAAGPVLTSQNPCTYSFGVCLRI